MKEIKKRKQEIRFRIYLIVAWILMYVLMLLYVSSCSKKIPLQQTVDRVVVDTFLYQVLPVEQVEGVLPKLGERVYIPSIQMEVQRINEEEVLVRTPIRQETIRESVTAFVAVKSKTVDKSDNRTYQDSYNRSKVKDKSQGGMSGWRVKLAGWWWIVLLLAGFILYHTRKFWLPFIPRL